MISTRAWLTLFLASATLAPAQMHLDLLPTPQVGWTAANEPYDLTVSVDHQNFALSSCIVTCEIPNGVDLESFTPGVGTIVQVSNLVIWTLAPADLANNIVQANLKVTPHDAGYVNHFASYGFEPTNTPTISRTATYGVRVLETRLNPWANHVEPSDLMNFGATNTGPNDIDNVLVTVTIDSPAAVLAANISTGYLDEVDWPLSPTSGSRTVTFHVGSLRANEGLSGFLRIALDTNDPINATLMTASFFTTNHPDLAQFGLVLCGLNDEPDVIPSDYDGDGQDEPAVQNVDSGDVAVNEGSIDLPPGTPVSGDYDGDSIADPVVYDSTSATWTKSLSKSGQVTTEKWGRKKSVPVPADYNGDGIVDLGVYIPATGAWMTRGGTRFYNWGSSKGVPAPADYNGDHKADMAVYFPSSGEWWIGARGGRPWFGTFGGPGYVPAPADYDGDGFADVALYQPSSGNWYIMESYFKRFRMANFGWSEAVPVPADYDGDRRADFAVYHAAAGQWYINNSGKRTIEIRNRGSARATPVHTQYQVNRRFGLLP
jgi:hypothetical protein